MKIVFASDSFKGSLSSQDITGLLQEVTADVFPKAQTVPVLMADGGEGTVQSLVDQLGGSYRTVEVKGPLFEPIMASYGFLPGGCAIIETAEASGLAKMKPGTENALMTTSYGTGQLIADAVAQGCRKIIVALGGSAFNDGGMGAMSALGAVFKDSGGKELRGIGKNLDHVAEIDLSKMPDALQDIEWIGMCDVVNPLLGKEGATYTYGPQKGANPTTLDRMEQGMARYAALAAQVTGVDAAAMPGGAAAGGLAFALVTYLNATLKSGIETVLDLTRFDETLQDASLVITGEGRMDWQSAYGKVVSGVSKRCKKAGVPVIAITGGLLDGYQNIFETGLNSVITTVSGVMTLQEAMEESRKLYKDAAYRILSAVRCGMTVQNRL